MTKVLQATQEVKNKELLIIESIDVYRLMGANLLHKKTLTNNLP